MGIFLQAHFLVLVMAKDKCSDPSGHGPGRAIATKLGEYGGLEEAQRLGATWGVNLRCALWSRVAGAMVDGAFLLEPMWLLTANEGSILALGSTIGCVLAFWSSVA